MTGLRHQSEAYDCTSSPEQLSTTPVYTLRKSLVKRQPRCSDEAQEWPEDESDVLDLDLALELIDLSNFINQPQEDPNERLQAYR